MRTVAEKKMSKSASNEPIIVPSKYGCEILLEKTTLQEVKNPSFPNDAYLIWYMEEEKEYLDLCRTPKMVTLFDMYYDKYGPGSVKKIDFGYGRVSPKLWAYKKPEKRKKK